MTILEYCACSHIPQNAVFVLHARYAKYSDVVLGNVAIFQKLQLQSHENSLKLR